jgi:hypothetical protein
MSVFSVRLVLVPVQLGTAMYYYDVYKA